MQHLIPKEQHLIPKETFRTGWEQYWSSFQESPAKVFWNADPAEAAQDVATFKDYFLPGLPLVDKPEVVGMMSSSVPDYEYLDENDPSTAQLQNTNLSICVPAPQIADALETFKTLHPPKVEQLQPLSDYLATIPIKTTVEWEVFGPVQP